ncbi:hypothetical protein [Chromobacterium alticapitis]|uniref:hypothetical protein n=1 Tax=Chromobacterium alticapitis TaxID=2073169 RepID=UPI0011AFE196|nr:hypothetical protein [Chromobacterium alticapitis]
MMFAILAVEALMLVNSKTAILLMLSLIYVQTFSEGGQLLYMMHDICEKLIYPSLINKGLCRSVNDCDKKDYVFATSTSDSIRIALYGVVDKGLIAEVVNKLNSNNYPVSYVTFYKEPHQLNGSILLTHTVVAKYRLR